MVDMFYIFAFQCNSHQPHVVMSLGSLNSQYCWWSPHWTPQLWTPCFLILVRRSSLPNLGFLLTSLPFSLGGHSKPGGTSCGSSLETGIIRVWGICKTEKGDKKADSGPGWEAFEEDKQLVPGSLPFQQPHESPTLNLWGFSLFP